MLTTSEKKLSQHSNSNSRNSGNISSASQPNLAARITNRIPMGLPYGLFSGLICWFALFLVLFSTEAKAQPDQKVTANITAAHIASFDKAPFDKMSSDKATSHIETSSSLTGYTIQDSEKQVYFERPPQRIAVLSWDLAEQLLELDVIPVAMPEIRAYHDWVVRPQVPESVQELGLRSEPNLERLAAVKPDLIILANRQKDVQHRFSRIAPVLYFETYSKQHNNAEAAITIFRTLAKLVQKEDLAEQKLTQMQADIEAMKSQLVQAYQGQLPDVSTVRFASLTSVFIYGDNSIAHYALKQLGISPALPSLPSLQARTQWGITQTRLLNLREIEQGSVLYFTPFEHEKKLKTSPIWQAMPFVRAGRSNRIKPTWTYGGAMSIKYMAQALTESLLAIAPAPSLSKSISQERALYQSQNTDLKTDLKADPKAALKTDLQANLQTELQIDRQTGLQADLKINSVSVNQ
ncbi:iron-siderophore ABC transporter substrate-binding protein [Oceanospirillum beijerinckii]|uniref:iron-siderophore ABC transporter substrate-binding protein n=1 Tax=Oceanospirillum beijerinckii TaxID=64976 RepID=UPI0004041526|nr:iron-siderophore ABC transporter substrate-binding protein [Oceanospirillum beijerinckii]